MNIFQEIKEKLMDINRIVTNRIFQEEGLDGVKEFEDKMLQLQGWDKADRPELWVDSAEAIAILVELEGTIDKHIEKMQKIRNRLRDCHPGE